MNGNVIAMTLLTAEIHCSGWYISEKKMGKPLKVAESYKTHAPYSHFSLKNTDTEFLNHEDLFMKICKIGWPSIVEVFDHMLQKTQP